MLPGSQIEVMVGLAISWERCSHAVKRAICQNLLEWKGSSREALLTSGLSRSRSRRTDSDEFQPVLYLPVHSMIEHFNVLTHYTTMSESAYVTVQDCSPKKAYLDIGTKSLALTAKHQHCGLVQGNLAAGDHLRAGQGTCGPQNTCKYYPLKP